MFRKFLSYVGAGASGALVVYLTMRPGAGVREDVAVEPVRAVAVGPVVMPVAGIVQEELARLAKEKVELETQLIEARTELAAREAVLAKTKEALEEVRRPMTEDVLSSSLRAEMKSGEAIVTGGYRLPDGKRLYAFATPVLEQGADGGHQVKIGFQMFRLTDEQGESVGLGALSTNAANTLQHGEVWIADEYSEVIRKLRSTPGMEGANVSPDLTVQPGGSGVIDTEDFKLKVTPERSDASDGLNVELRLEQPVKPAP